MTESLLSLAIVLHTLVNFTVDGEPVPQARPRFTKTGRTYTSKRCSDYRQLVASCAKKAMIGKSIAEKNIPIVAFIDFFRSKKTTARSDIDNLIKAILDACNMIVYQDDSQIVKIYASKNQSSSPRVNVYFFISED